MCDRQTSKPQYISKCIDKRLLPLRSRGPQRAEIIDASANNILKRTWIRRVAPRTGDASARMPAQPPSHHMAPPVACDQPSPIADVDFELQQAVLELRHVTELKVLRPPLATKRPIHTAKHQQSQRLSHGWG